MSQFKFELEDVLKLRIFEKDAAQAELGKAVAEENRIQNDLDILAMQYNNVKKTNAGSTDVSVIFSQNNYFKGIKLQQEKLFEDMAKAKLVTESKRKIFNEAFKKCESLEKLKEQHRNIFLAEQDRLESEELEEIVLSAASWRAKNSDNK